MSAEPSERAEDEHDLIHLGGETGVVVPLEEYRMLSALRSGAPEADLEDALAIARHEADKAAGRVTGVTDDELEAALGRYEAGQPWA